MHLATKGASVRTFTIFYSWQSDRERKCCKDFIRRAADAAAVQVGERCGVRIVVDADTEGVAGTPAISDTILRKIEACDLFLADMTFVATADSGKRVPNPNVMGEYGFALHAKGLDRILLVMNTAFGSPEELPFDLRHLRHPARYTLHEGASDGVRRRTRAEFSTTLERNIAAAIERLLELPSVVTEPTRWDAGLAALGEFANSRFAGVPMLVTSPKLIVWAAPLTALTQPLLTAAKVKAARPLFSLSPDGRAYEGQDEQQWWSSAPPRHLTGKPNPEATWCVRLVRPGFFEVAVTIGARINDDPQIVVQGLELERLLVDAVDRVATLSARLGLSGPAVLTAALEGIQDVEIHRPRPGPGGRRIKRPAVTLGTVQLENFTAPTADHLVEMMERMWLVGGWDDGSPAFVNGHWIGHASS
jgi:hypothetical protein